jgi:hypothetical protein
LEVVHTKKNPNGIGRIAVEKLRLCRQCRRGAEDVQIERHLHHLARLVVLRVHPKCADLIVAGVSGKDGALGNPRRIADENRPVGRRRR